MNAPIVSVVIPAYNHEDYVQETIASIIQQSYPRIEIIVIDDGSTDATWKKIRECKEACENRFIRTVLLTQKNEGRCVTLNRLLEQTTGDFVYIIASDDIAKPDAIDTLVSFLDSHPEYVLAVGDNELIDARGNTIHWDSNLCAVYDESDAVYKTYGSFLEQSCGFSFCSENFGTYSSFCRRNYIPNGYLVRNEVLKSYVRFTESAPLEDYWLMLQLSKYGKMKYIDDVLFSYRWHQNNTVHNREYMQSITLQTWKHEENNIQNPGFEAFKHIFEREACKTTIKFQFGRIFKYYKEETITGKRRVLEILGRSYILKDSTFKETK